MTDEPQVYHSLDEFLAAMHQERHACATCNHSGHCRIQSVVVVLDCREWEERPEDMAGRLAQECLADLAARLKVPHD